MREKILKLRPTQFVLGLKEVEDKVKKLKNAKLKGKDLDDYLDSHKVPIVIGPENIYYMIDRHHVVRACWETGVEEVEIEVRADFSDQTTESFWEVMIKLKWCHLEDQFGNGPHSPLMLPTDIKGMSDDRYRSLAWMCREAGGFKKSSIPFAEFYWADWFRKKLKVTNEKNSLDEAFKEAMELCKKKEAENLPGYKK